MYLDANLKAYYETNIVDIIDDMEIEGVSIIAKQKVKVILRILLSKNGSVDFIENQLPLYHLLFIVIYSILLRIKDELLEELNICSELSFDKEREGEINTNMFLLQQNTYKNIHKIITTILQLNIGELKTLAFGKNEDNINVLIIKT
jgi:hypothetical protein